MDAFVEGQSEKPKEPSLEEDLLETSWSLYHAGISAVQRDIQLLRSEVCRRLGERVAYERKKDSASQWALEGWLRQETRVLEMHLRALFLSAMRECALERAARAQAIRKFCDKQNGKRSGDLQRSP